MRARGASLVFGPRIMACEVRRRTIRLRVSTALERYRAETYATKEPETLDWLEGELREGDVLFDVGANIGLYSLFAAALGRRARVYAFEPEAQNFAQLCWNVHLNGFQDVTPVAVALSDREGCDVLCVSAIGAGEAFHGLGRPSDHRLGGPAVAFRQGTLALTVDRLVELGLPSPTLLKLDVDGLEPDILRGAERTLSGGKVRSLLVEVNPPAGGGTGTAATLERLGFREAFRGPAVRTGMGGTGFNCVFRRA